MASLTIPLVMTFKQALSIFTLVLFTLSAASETRVFLEHSETLSFDERRLPDAQILKGNVRFRHEEALMFRDSAYFYENTNSVTAFGNVRFEQGDTLRGFGNRLYYDGNTKLARLCRNVILIHRSTTLTTDSLNYDRIADKAYYFTGGIIQDSINTLQSVWGEYNPPTSTAFFRNKVTLHNESLDLSSDTLIYNTQTAIAQIVSPTDIYYEDETHIVSSNGWYNTSDDQAMLLNRSEIHHTDGRNLTGDSIFYDRLNGYGRLTNNITVNDTTRYLSLHGNKCELWEKDKNGYMTDRAIVEEWSEEDKRHYLHADTLFFAELPCIDSTCTDTFYYQLNAYHNVRGWSEEYQLICDSISFNTFDSLLILHHSPIVWNEDLQVSADSIVVYIINGSVDHAYGTGNVFFIKQETKDYYNQLTGKEFYAYVKDGELTQIDANINAQTVFYPRDDKDNITGVNKTQSAKVQIYLEERKVHHILFTTATTGTMYPLDQISSSECFINGFVWAEAERPSSIEDLFNRPPRTTATVHTADIPTADTDEHKETEHNHQHKTQKNKKRK